VIGFGARALGDEMPKYLNSPQTPIFDKSSTLYALDRAFAEVRKTRTLVVVEGYMDAIAAHQFGFANAVASMGTALTEAQVHAIRNYVDKVFVALDSDAAGQLATIRAIDTLREGFATNDAVSVDARGMIRAEHSLGAEIRVVMLEGGKDPDEIIRTDPALWQAALDDAVPLVEYILNSRLTSIEDSPAARAEALRDIAAPVLREVRDPIVQAEYIDLTARLLGYKEHVVRQALSTRRRAREPEPVRRQPERRPAADPERWLVGLLLSYPLGYANRVGTLQEVAPEMFRDARHREIVGALAASSWEASSALETLADELVEYARALIARTPVRDDLSPGMANNEIIQAVETLNKARFREMERQVLAEIEEAKASGDSALLAASLRRMTEIAELKKKFDPRVSPYFHDLRTKAS
jgi:DNA primase